MFTFRAKAIGKERRISLESWALRVEALFDGNKGWVLLFSRYSGPPGRNDYVRVVIMK